MSNPERWRAAAVFTGGRRAQPGVAAFLRERFGLPPERDEPADAPAGTVVRGG